MKYSVRNFFLTLIISLIFFTVVAIILMQIVNAFLDSDGPASEFDDNNQLVTAPVTGIVGSGEKNDVTFFIAGTDGVLGYCDTMMIVKIDKENERFIIVSVPPEMELFMDGAEQSISALSRTRDIRFIADKLWSISGIKCDYYIHLKMDGFVELIDILGGIEYNVPQNMKYSDPEQALYINLDKGFQILDGESALQLVRFKDYQNGSDGRLATQVNFMKAVFDKVLKSDNIEQAKLISEQVFATFESDLSVAAFLQNIDLFFKYDVYSTQVLTYPTTKVTENGRSYIVPNVDYALDFFKPYK